MSRKVKKSLRIYSILSLAVIMVLSLVVLPQITADAQSAFQQTFKGFRVDKNQQGWTTGNLGKEWIEGEWVPYQVILSNVQGTYPNLQGMPDIEVSYDFTNKGYRFVDLVRSIQAGTVELTDNQGWPQNNGNAYPMGNMSQIKVAQNSVGEYQWDGFTLLNLPNSQVHRDLGGGIGTPSDGVRKFVVKPSDLIAAGFEEADTIVIYFQLHVSRTFIWENSLQSGYNTSPTDAWGGYVYGNSSFSSDQRMGSSFVPGSSGHAHLQVGGSKTVPIPIPQGQPGSISGQKWLDSNKNAVKDSSEDRLSGWEIFVSGRVDGINVSFSTLTDSSGNYSFPNLTSGTTWRVSEALQREVPAQDGFVQTYPYSGASSVGQATAVSHSVQGQAAWAWDVNLTAANPNQANVDFGNFLADPQLTISKDADTEVSKVGDTINYSFVIKNTGNVDLERVLVEDSVIGVVTSQFPQTLAPDQEETVVVPYVVKENDPDPLVNVITATYHVAGNQSWNVIASDDHSMKLVKPSIKLTKSVSPGTTMVGNQVTYTIRVENNGDWALRNMEVTDPLLGGDITAAFGFGETLGIGEWKQATFTYTVDAGDVENGKVVNTAEVYSNPVGLPNDIEDEDSAEITIINPEIQITKSVAPETTMVGNEVTYTIRVTNTGNYALENIVVTDALLGGNITAAFGFGDTLEPDAWKEATFPYTVDENDVEDGKVNNTVYVTSNPVGLSNEVKDDDSAQVTVVNPDIQITKTVAPTIGMLEDVVVYTIRVTNTGDYPLENIVVTDALLGGDITAAFGFGDTLAPGAWIERTFNYTIDEGDVVDGQVDNTVYVTSNPVDMSNEIKDDDSAEVSVAIPDIEILKSVNPTTTNVGNQVTYTIRVTNTGNWALENLVVTDALLGGDITAAFGFGLTLGAGDWKEATFPYTIKEGDIEDEAVVNTAYVTSNPVQFPAVEVKDDDDAIVFVGVNPAIEVTKTPNTTVANLGEEVTYTFVVTNTGDVTLVGVTAVDSPLGTVDLEDDTLASGESTTGTLTKTYVAADLPGPMTNTVTATGYYLGNPVTDTASASVSLMAIEVTKMADFQGDLEIGAVIEYIFEVTNTGSATLYNVTAVDTPLGPVTNLGKSTLLPGESTTGSLFYTTTEEDYPSEKQNTVVAVGENGDRSVTDSASLTLQLPELPEAGPVLIRKVVENGEAADEDQPFYIEVRDSDNQLALPRLTIRASDGLVALELEEGTYTIHEVDIADGFTLVGITGLDNGGVIVVTTESSHIITVTNRKGDLPPTGGISLFGIGALLGLGGLALKKRMNKK